MKRGRKRKLDTPDDIERVCASYYLFDESISRIARNLEVSPPVVTRIINEHGAVWLKTHEAAMHEKNRR